MSRLSGSGRTIWRRTWGFLTSRRLAVVLFLLTLAVLSAGLWLPQVPTDLDVAGQEAWWAALRQRHGSSLDLFVQLGLLQVERSALFLALVAALLANGLLCTVDRIAAVWRSLVRRPPPRLPAAAYEPADWQAGGLTLEQARRVLRGQRLRLREEAGGGHYFYGGSGQLVPLGTVLTHLGLLLVPLAALLHGTLAWRDRLVLDPGAVPVSLPWRPDCAVLLTEVVPGAAPQGSLLIQEGDSVRQGHCGPAQPIAACGATFYAHSYGLAVRVEAWDSGGQPLPVVLAEGSPLRLGEGAAGGSFDVPALGLHGTITPVQESPTNGGAPAALRLDQAGRPVYEGLLSAEEQPPGDLRAAIDVAGGRLSLDLGYFLTVEAVHDPGLAALILGGLFLVGGGALSLLWPQRRLWARWSEAGTLHVRLGNRTPDELVRATATLQRAARRVTGGGP